MKNETAPAIAITSATVKLGALTVTVSAPSGALLITLPNGAKVRRVKGSNPRATLAAWVATLHPDAQLDTLDAIRAAARLVSPGDVSDRSTLELYPRTVVRI